MLWSPLKQQRVPRTPGKTEELKLHLSEKNKFGVLFFSHRSQVILDISRAISWAGNTDIQVAMQGTPACVVCGAAHRSAMPYIAHLLLSGHTL